MPNLLPNEKVIMRLPESKAALTTIRVACVNQLNAQESVMLEDIIACQVFISKLKWLPMIANLLFFIGIASSIKSNFQVLGILSLIALVFYFCYWLTYQTFITIETHENIVQINVTGLDKDEVEMFITKLEQAKKIKAV